MITIREETDLHNSYIRILMLMIHIFHNIWKTFFIYYENKFPYIVKIFFHADEKSFSGRENFMKMQFCE